MEELKYYLKKIKNNAKVFYDEEVYEKESKYYGWYSLFALAPLVCTTILVITPLTIISYNILNGDPLFYVCCIFWVFVLCWILAILFRDF